MEIKTGEDGFLEATQVEVEEYLKLMLKDEATKEDLHALYREYHQDLQRLALYRKRARQLEHNSKLYELQQMENYTKDGLKVTDARNKAKLDNREQLAKVFEAQCDVDILTADVTTLQHIITHLEQKENNNG